MCGSPPIRTRSVVRLNAAAPRPPPEKSSCAASRPTVISSVMAKGKQASWGGRFSAGPAALMLEFSESVSFDRRLAPFDIAGSKAHSAMLAHVGMITTSERDAIHG